MPGYTHKMKKRIAVCLIVLVSIGYGAFAQETGFKAFRFDAGAGITAIIPSIVSDDAKGTTYSFGPHYFRENTHVGLRYALTENVSLGVDAGLNVEVWVIGFIGLMGLETPVHGSVRLTFGNFAIEPFGGYFFDFIQKSAYQGSCPEAGCKIMFGPSYYSLSFLFTDPLFYRVEVGVQINDILKF